LSHDDSADRLLRQKEGRSIMHRILKRRSVRTSLWLAGLIAFVMFMLWQRCGLKGCFDVDGVRINKPTAASMIVYEQGHWLGK
jgi:hypothetical protein